MSTCFTSFFSGAQVEGTECYERAILPEKASREELHSVIESDFSKVTMSNTVKYFKAHSQNQCVAATIKILEYSFKKKEVPKPYQTLLDEIRKDSPIWGAPGQGRTSSTRSPPPARWPSSDLICPIFSNKWLYLNISRTLQIHDQGDSHNLLSVGWSFKMANKWSLINATWGNAQHL